MPTTLPTFSRGRVWRVAAAAATLTLAATGLSGTAFAEQEAVPVPPVGLEPVEPPMSKIPAETRASATAELRESLGVTSNDRRALSASDAAKEVVRVAGSNRYETSVATSWYTPWGDIDGDGELGEVELNDGSTWTEEPAPIAYVATGENYPDALSAAAPAGAQGGPLLLTRTDSLPQVVADELTRLQPEQIVVAGGEAVVSTAVYDELAAIQPNIRRDAGDNRYETSRILSERGFSDQSWYQGGTLLATGSNFPDALAASAAGGTYGAPVVLVQGGRSDLDSETEALLSRLDVNWAAIAGNTAVVSKGLETDLVATLGADYVYRFGGANRYQTAVVINDAFFGWDHEENDYIPGTANIATGVNFPDALGAAALAGIYHEPLYTSRTNCIPAATLDHIEHIEAPEIWIYGGESVLSPAVESLTTC